MTALEDTINIGPTLASDLRAAGIPDLETLREVGLIEAVTRLEAGGLHDCTHALLALDGALCGIRWTALPVEEKEAVKRTWQNRTRGQISSSPR